tara:strand:+ start:2328 stop:2909 length:582 start_codon:yes stop_codon:yes gene_type:complete
MRYIVTAIAERSENVEYLKTHIPNLEVVWDTKQDAMDTFLRGCQAGFGSAVVRLEDDILLTKNFTEKAEKFISLSPSHVIQFFSRSKDDLTKGTRLKPGGTFSMNQCYYLPHEVSEDLVRFYDSAEWQSRKLEHPYGYDTMMAHMFRLQKRPYILSVPSLVEHAQIVSRIDKRRSKFRQSKTFTDPELESYPY